MGLILQGGGALGAYEYGAVTRLVELGWEPVAVSGVSIGAVNAAAIAGARDSIGTSLDWMWREITLHPVPWLANAYQATLSMFGNPNFYRLRTDFWTAQGWTSLCDISPMLETLDRVCDFDKINDPGQMRFAVTTTDVANGKQVTFSNRLPASQTRIERPNHVSKADPIAPKHVMASGSLPPGFPMTEIGGVSYWDGGLFDNTPIDAFLDLLEDDELDDLPVFVIDLFPSGVPLPRNLIEVQNRMTEISYQNRFWAEYGGAGGFSQFASMLKKLRLDNPTEADTSVFKWLSRLRALKNFHILVAERAGSTGGMDFSAAGVTQRYDMGRAAVERHFDEAEMVQAAE